MAMDGSPWGLRGRVPKAFGNDLVLAYCQLKGDFFAKAQSGHGLGGAFRNDLTLLLHFLFNLRFLLLLLRTFRA